MAELMADIPDATASARAEVLELSDQQEEVAPDDPNSQLGKLTHGVGSSGEPDWPALHQLLGKRLTGS